MTRWATVVLVGTLMLVPAATAAGGVALPPDATLGDYLAAFDAAYQPPDHVVSALLDAEAGVQRAAWAAAPSVEVEESLRLTDFASLALEVTADVRLPLFASDQAANAALAASTLEHQRAFAATTRIETRERFAADVLAFALLSDAANVLTRGLHRVRSAGPSQDAGAALDLPPDARNAYAQERRLAGLASFLEASTDDLRRRLARSLDLDPSSLTAPAVDATLAAFSGSLPAHEQCLAAAPAAADAHARYRQRTLQEALAAAPEVSVLLIGGVGYRHAVGDAGAAPGSAGGAYGNVGIEARIALATGGPVNGSASATLDLDGFEQSLRLTWPPRSTPMLPAGRSVERVLDDELHALDANLRSLRRAHEQAVARRAEGELRLGWFLRDQGVEETHSAPLSDPVADLLAAEHRANLAFARLDEALAWLELRLACGPGT